MNDVDDLDPLCCCEYFDRNHERNHMLLCCCGCDEFDEICERIICCRSVDRKLRREMWLTVKDRLRVPYPGGAQQLFGFESLLPLILLISSQLISTINLYCTIAVFLIMNLGLIYYRRISYAANYRTNFYYYWCVWSVVYLLTLFQTYVPLMEILPEENLLLIILLLATVICFRVIYRSNNNNNRTYTSSKVTTNFDDSSTVLLMPCDDNTSGKDCINNVNSEDGEYEIWIGSTINHYNRKFYIAGCCLGVITFLWYSNLVITSVCHPFPVLRIFNRDILMPDDCTDVYDQFEIAICFVAGLYAIYFSIFLFIKCIQELILITKGASFIVTKSNERNSQKSCYNNWKSFLCN